MMLFINAPGCVEWLHGPVLAGDAGTTIDSCGSCELCPFISSNACMRDSGWRGAVTEKVTTAILSQHEYWSAGTEQWSKLDPHDFYDGSKRERWLLAAARWRERTRHLGGVPALAPHSRGGVVALATASWSGER